MADSGEDVLDRYADTGDPALLDAAIDLLEAERTADPAGPDALWRAHLLGLAYAERGDHDRAIAWLTDVVHFLDPSPERDEDAAMLADAWLDRTCLSRSGEKHAAAVVSDLVAGFTDEKLANYARMVHGMILLSEDDVDPAAGIAVLAPALDVLAPDTPRYVQASAWLCLALRQAGRHELDRSIDVGRRAADSAAPDDPAGPLLMDFLAQSYQDRWDDGETDRADLDHAIACWQRAIAADPDPHALSQCGRLLRERADRSRDMGDVREAVRMLEQAVREPDPVRWFQLARAGHAGWRFGSDRALLDRAVYAIDQAVAGYDEVDDLLLWLHAERLLIWNSRNDDHMTRNPTEPPLDAAGMRRHITEARAVWDRLGEQADPDARAMLAVLLGLSELYGGLADPGSVDMGRVASLLAIGRAMTDPGHDLLALLDGADAIVQYILDAQRGGHRDGGLTPLIRALSTPSADEEDQARFRQVLPVVLLGNGIRSGDRRLLQAAMDQLPGADPDLAVMARVWDLMLRSERGEMVGDEVEQLTAELAANPPSYTAQQMAAVPLRMLRSLYDGMAGRPSVLDRTPLPAVTGLDAAPVIGGAMAAVFGPLVAAIGRHDVPVLRDCAARLAEIAAATPPENTMRMVVYGLAGQAELAVARDDPADRSAAGRAAGWLERATEIAGGPQHPIWAMAAINHAEALRRMPQPDLARSRELGRSALRGLAWQVLLQSGTDDAVTVAARASAHAMTVAEWCQADGAGEELVAALDAGRGLVLHAATASRGIADQLIDAGREDLAERWRESAGFGHDVLSGGLLGALTGGGPEVPDDLRTRVLQVLGADDPVRGGTFTPASTPEIREALTGVGADALVYLVPATMTRPGTAVVVPVSGGVDTVILPDLVTGPRSVVARLAAAGLRDAGEVDAAEAAAGASVDEVCHWAWSAAIGPLLRHTSRWVLARPVRLVLVPMGLLGTVPWHGAFRPDQPGGPDSREGRNSREGRSGTTRCGTRSSRTRSRVDRCARRRSSPTARSGPRSWSATRAATCRTRASKPARSARPSIPAAPMWTARPMSWAGSPPPRPAPPCCISPATATSTRATRPTRIWP